MAYALRWVAGWVFDALVRVVWFLDSLHQGIVWILVILTLGYLTLRLGARAGPRPTGTGRPSPQPRDRSELASLVAVIERAVTSPRAREELAQRLAQVAVALRVRRDAVSPRQAWDDLEAGRWPPNHALSSILHPTRRLPFPAADYPQQLAAAVDTLSHYAKGGHLDGT
ncbi:MAG: hypothetical protein KA136_00880 [Candidatus Bipolaricaulis sp.]|nr:hypothetical protein [Candidatus Bipolaricaulis sp.]